MAKFARATDEMKSPLTIVLGTAPAFFALVAMSIVSNILMLTSPVFMLQIYDRVLASRSIPTLVALTVLVIGLFAFYAIIEVLRGRMSTRYSEVFDEELSPKILAAAIRARLTPMSRLHDPMRDLDTMRQFYGGPGPSALLDLPWVPIYVMIVYAFHPLLGHVTVAGALIMLILMLLNEFLSQAPTRELTVEGVKRQTLAEDARQNAEAVLSMAMLNPILGRWQDTSRGFNTAFLRAADNSSFFASVTKAFRLLLQSLVLGAGAYLVIVGQVNAGIMIASSIITSRALAPIEQVVGQWRSFVAARQASRRTYELLKAAEQKPRASLLPPPRRSFSVNHLTSGPHPRLPPTIFGINFALRAGDGLGILGPSGSGKSTLVRAMVGVWPAIHGTVRLDDSELPHYDPHVLGNAVGYLPQTVELFDGTVAQNICRFRTDATMEAIMQAAELSGVHDLIASLPDGYDTQIGDRGSQLSAGQRQRIGLARAMFNEPFLIVLDEPNSNLDAEGENALARAVLNARNRGAIVAIVAHRPSAITALDKLLFLQAGRQVRFGTKEEVLQQIAPQTAQVANKTEGASNG